MAGNRKRVNLALQGGGSHGAFTWGVLDRLLEDGRLEIVGICGTSAGAMNGAALAYGFARGGAAEARRILREFWCRVGERGRVSPLQPTPLDRLVSIGDMDFSPTWQLYDTLSRMVSPYLANPCNVNPLAEVLDEVIDFAWLREHRGIRLFVCATNVRTGKIKVFGGDEVSAEAVMASACLPFLFQAVEIEGEAYWDGGYMGNPAIFPLIYHCGSSDVVVVHINPIERPDVPRGATEIMNRVNEISFNSSLMREMRAVAFVTRLIEDGTVRDGALKRMHVHAIAADAVMQKLSVMSKLNADWEFLTHLRDDGREHAAAWLAQNFDRLGRESTIDVGERYL